jgi:hypothetical protein|tara:strand:+ start:206 stop:325 length:120 start_codon:yes stop_codon:yes gene_type:complete
MPAKGMPDISKKEMVVTNVTALTEPQAAAIVPKLSTLNF